ncbi:MAG: PAS domain S-box protein, partial [Chloroflexi bacterium]|nr:PAS domain S-box protein [Chloroflexota bacterium]
LAPPEQDLAPPEQDLAKDITWIDSEGALAQPGLYMKDLVRHALDSGEPQWRQDTAPSDNGSAYLAVPFQYMGETLGAIGLQTHTALPPHHDWRGSILVQQDLHFLTDLADRIVGRLYRMRLLAEVSATHHKTDLVLQNIVEGVCTVSDDLHITSANPAMEHITGWQESELLGRRYDEIFAPKANKRRLLPEQTLPGQALCASGTMVSARHTILCQDGRRIPVTGKATLLRNADASVRGVVTTMHDLTPEIELEQLRHAFKTIIAHALCTPLTHINASIEALLQTDLPDDVRHEILDVLQTQSIQLDQLAGGVPNVRRPESEKTSPHYHPVTLKPIIEQVVKYFQTAATNHALKVKLTPDLPFVIGDENKIELALANIIDNALIQNDSQQSIVISADTSHDNVIVTVEGIGQATSTGKTVSSPPL